MRLPWVARDDAIRAGFDGQLEQGFVVRVGEVRRPVGLELTLLSGGADGVQHVVNVSQRQFHFCGITFGHFFVFEQEMIAQQQLPAIRASCWRISKAAPCVDHNAPRKTFVSMTAR